MVGNKYRPTYRVAEIVLLIGSLLSGWIGSFFPGLGIKDLVAEILETAAVEGAASRFGFDFDSAGAVAAILCAVVRGENLEFGNGFGIGINVEGSVAAVIHVVAAVKLPVVVLGATAVHAVRHVTVDADFGVVLTSLAHHAWRQIDQLRKIAAVKHEVVDLFAGNGTGEIGRLCFDLSHALACYLNYFGNSAHSQLHVDAD